MANLVIVPIDNTWILIYGVRKKGLIFDTERNTLEPAIEQDDYDSVIVKSQYAQIGNGKAIALVHYKND